MSCEKCLRQKPGSLIKVDKNSKCVHCGQLITQEILDISKQAAITRWDRYFSQICVAVSSKSPCLSRKIGAILVRDKSIISTGFNGPARGYPHCTGECPRKKMGYESGEGLIHCPAAHAEANCIANAAKIGASVNDSILYMNCIIPCKDCMTALVNAGVREIVVDELTPYHEVSWKIAEYGGIKLRRFFE